MSEKGLFAAICGFFKNLMSPAQDAPSNTSAPAAQSSGDGMTGVAQYIARQDARSTTGVAQYIANLGDRKMTGVAQYIAKLDA